jgi:hypothetical protein
VEEQKPRTAAWVSSGNPKPAIATSVQRTSVPASATRWMRSPGTFGASAVKADRSSVIAGSLRTRVSPYASNAGGRSAGRVDGQTSQSAGSARAWNGASVAAMCSRNASGASVSPQSARTTALKSGCGNLVSAAKYPSLSTSTPASARTPAKR